jgi:hypothetical protein
MEPIGSLNPTKLGKLLGLSAREVNKKLLALGLQRKNACKEWELIEAGGEYCGAYPYDASTGHADFQVLWSPKSLFR